MSRLRIATWNLERPKPKGYIKNNLRLDQIRKINADIWILTETSSAIMLDGFNCLASKSDLEYHSEGESYAAIWSRWPILCQIPTYDPYFTVCAKIDSPFGLLIVYGTIITYANDKGPSGTARRWEEHRKSIKLHAADWHRLWKEFSDHLFCVAGDFNQSRDGSGWYEDALSVRMLSSALDHASFKCVTEENFRENGLLQSRSSIDHICLSKSLAKQVVKVGVWEGTTVDGSQMSDHNGIFIDIQI